MLQCLRGGESTIGMARLPLLAYSCPYGWGVFLRVCLDQIDRWIHHTFICVSPASGERVSSPRPSRCGSRTPHPPSAHGWVGPARVVTDQHMVPCIIHHTYVRCERLMSWSVERPGNKEFFYINSFLNSRHNQGFYSYYCTPYSFIRLHSYSAVFSEENDLL